MYTFIKKACRYSLKQNQEKYCTKAVIRPIPGKGCKPRLMRTQACSVIHALRNKLYNTIKCKYIIHKRNIPIRVQSAFSLKYLKTLIV